jgi:hypothetical protein
MPRYPYVVVINAKIPIVVEIMGINTVSSCEKMALFYFYSVVFEIAIHPS